ncbi:hypothetical protein DERF_003491 [Dermatophagoides farinae]|uniref:Uncharacterized protein n=1 Tax=Dermatophagoides farinae TaxID=6954 RepID=A0A922LDK7_DERFA|nr:hypothetical protein DERF_003491 [Dermatophagoides farinae]
MEWNGMERTKFAKICNSNLTLNLASLSIKLYFIFGSSFQMETNLNYVMILKLNRLNTCGRLAIISP